MKFWGIRAGCQKGKKASYQSNIPPRHIYRAFRISASNALSMLATKWCGDELPVGRMFGTVSSNFCGDGDARSTPDPSLKCKVMPFIPFFSMYHDLSPRGLLLDCSALSSFYSVGLVFFCEGLVSNYSPATTLDTRIVFILLFQRPTVRSTLGGFARRRAAGRSLARVWG